MTQSWNIIHKASLWTHLQLDISELQRDYCGSLETLKFNSATTLYAHECDIQKHIQRIEDGYEEEMIATQTEVHAIKTKFFQHSRYTVLPETTNGTRNK